LFQAQAAVPHHHPQSEQPSRAGRATDPVCGMTVDAGTSRHRHSHSGETYHFCSAGCRTKFAGDPAKYLGRNQSPVSAAAAPPQGGISSTAAGGIYTCPMHPQVRQIGPGACPICGMALEPEAGGGGDDTELHDMTRRFWIAAVLTLPLVAIAMSAHAGLWPLSESGGVRFVEMALATPVVLWAGAPFFVRGAQSLRTGNLNMFTLIAMGSGVAYGYSIAAAVAPDWFAPALQHGHDGAPLYFEAAAVIVVLVLLGQVLELRARASTAGAIRALMALTPQRARRITDAGEEEDVPLDAVARGDRLRVRPGERVPVDGAVIDGRSAIDESMITGEAMPAEKAAGDAVIGGTLNGNGSFVMRAERIGRDTMLAQIVALVTTAQRSRAPIAQLADRVSAWFVPAVIAVAIAAFTAWAAFGPEPRFVHAMVAAVTVLIIACPCALGLATPMSIMVGIGRAARAGILIRDAETLERLEQVDTLVLDKTGTLTEGKPKVTAAIGMPGFDEAAVLRLAAAVEQGSEHPLAAAIVKAAKDRNIATPPVKDFQALVGGGVSGMVAGQRVVLGNAALLAEHGVAVTPLQAEAERWRGDGATVVFIAADDRLAGLIAIADPVKPSAAAALDALRAQHISLVMLTGDHATTAHAVGKKLGIAAVEAGVAPARKHDAVAALRRSGHIVAMAGDGINDAPALAAADVGIAMGGGADVAMASAGMTLLNGDLAGIVRARRLSVATMRNIRQNLAFAFLYNALGVPIAAGALYPLFGITLSPAFGAAAMALSSVSVVANALRLRHVAL
jgi:Cu+-exporting ATPase